MMISLLVHAILSICGNPDWDPYFAPPPVLDVDSFQTSFLDGSGARIGFWESHVRERDEQKRPLRYVAFDISNGTPKDSTVIRLSWDQSGPSDQASFAQFKLSASPSRALETPHHGTSTAFTDTFSRDWSPSTRGLAKRIRLDRAFARDVSWLGYLQCNGNQWDDSLTFDSHDRIAEARSCRAILSGNDTIPEFEILSFHFEGDSDRFPRTATSRKYRPVYISRRGDAPEDLDTLPEQNLVGDTIRLYGSANTPDSAVVTSAAKGDWYHYRWSTQGALIGLSSGSSSENEASDFDAQGRPQEYKYYEAADAYRYFATNGTDYDELYQYSYSWGTSGIQKPLPTGDLLLRSVVQGIELSLASSDRIRIEVRKVDGALRSSSILNLEAGIHRLPMKTVSGDLVRVTSLASGRTQVIATVR
jgi:hypothetical protein